MSIASELKKLPMKFPEALAYVFQDGDRVTRRAWLNYSIYVSLVEGKLCITGFNDKGEDDKRPYPLIVTEQDWFGEDWEVVDD